MIKALNEYMQNMRKPAGIMGHVAMLGMNVGHTPVAWFGLRHLDFGKPQSILDIGCGGGANIKRMLALSPSSSRVDGIDHSEECVARSRRKNWRNVNRGRAIITVGDVSALDKPDKLYDVVTAFETVYFWPDIETAFREVYRVLKPGGAFLICNETDASREQDVKYARIIDGMKNYSPEDLKGLLEAAGFSDIIVDVNKLKFMVVMGYKR